MDGLRLRLLPCKDDVFDSARALSFVFTVEIAFADKEDDDRCGRERCGALLRITKGFALLPLTLFMFLDELLSILPRRKGVT